MGEKISNYKLKSGRVLNRVELNFILKHYNYDMEGKDIAKKLNISYRTYQGIIQRVLKNELKSISNYKKCIVCGKEYKIKRRTFATCGDLKCIKINGMRVGKECRRNKNGCKLRVVKCEICGRKFETYRLNQKRCNESCSKRPFSEMDPLIEKKVRKISLERYYYKDHEKILQQRRNCYDINKEKHHEWNKRSYEKNKDKKRLYSRNNRSRIRDRMRNQYKNDPTYRIKMNLKNRINHVLKGKSKSKTTMELVGCSIEFLWDYLESKFKEGMTRENHGKWHIDHIIPCSAFDLTNKEEQYKCFNYKNLQPLWARENLVKHTKIIY